MKILISTHNPSKFQRYSNLLKDIPSVQFVSLNELNISEKVPETHNNALQNAKEKAKNYAKTSGLPTLAIDESATTNFLPENEQPGVYVRRHFGTDHEMTDDEQLQHWKEIFNRSPQQKKTLTWTYSQAFFDPRKNEVKSSEVTTTNTITTEFSQTVLPGYPMSSFLIMEGTNKPHSELSVNEKNEVDKKIFKDFINSFKSWIIN